MKARRDRLFDLMREKAMDFVLITRPENMRYLTGYTGEGAVLLGEGRATILTDFRYVEQAECQAGDCPCMRTTPDLPLPRLMGQLVAEGRRLAVEGDYVTVREYRQLEDALKGVSLEDAQGLAQQLRMVKDEEEVELIRQASRIACRAFDKLLGVIRPGMTEREVQLTLDEYMLRDGSEQTAFQTIACAGVNGSLPHATPSDYVIQKGDLLTLDFGAQVKGYKTDMTRTVAVGPISDELKKIYQTVLEAQLRALDAIRPGLEGWEIDKVARDYIEPVYPGAFGHSLGHGVGLEIHETPNFSVKCHTAIQPGHVMTVEPGVYIEGVGGCRIEDTVVVRPGGCENLITAPKELITL